MLSPTITKTEAHVQDEKHINVSVKVNNYLHFLLSQILLMNKEHFESISFLFLFIILKSPQGKGGLHQVREEVLQP